MSEPKQDLLNLYPFTKPTFLKKLKILCEDKLTPFTYHQFVSAGHFIPKKWSNYIKENLY